VPEQDDELLHRCKNLIRTKHATDVLENSEKLVFALARTIEGKDKYTQGHVERVEAYSVQLGQQIGLANADIVALRKGSIVHDVGKIAVPDAILNKPGPLDQEEEWDIMRRHPVVGYDLLAPLRTFEPILPIVRWHHERPNGTGYPDGIGGQEIPLVARIVAVTDYFDALTTPRPYRQALSIERSLHIMNEAAAHGDLDPDLVAILCDLFPSNATL
jgi:putative two-component system response regulator